MRIYLFLFTLLFFSCSQNKETNNSTSEKEISKIIEDTLPRIEFGFPGEDLKFSVYEITQLDTAYHTKMPNDYLCGIQEMYFYTFKSCPKPNFSGFGGYTLEDSFEGIVFQIPRFKSNECFDPSIQLSLKDKIAVICQNFSMIPNNKGKPCLIKDSLINNREVMVYLDTVLQKSSYSYRMNVKLDSSFISITGYWKKENTELGKIIIKSIQSFK